LLCYFGIVILVTEELGDLNSSIEWYNRVLELNPKFMLAWNKRGDILSLRGEYEDSRGSYNKAIELNPKYVNTWKDKGDLFFKQEKYIESLAVYNNASELFPGNAGLWIGIGQSLEKLGRTDESVSAYKKAISLDPNYAKDPRYAKYTIDPNASISQKETAQVQVHPVSEKYNLTVVYVPIPDRGGGKIPNEYSKPLLGKVAGLKNQ
jgi:tetratricopeptide (TPR) repeat protein